MLVVLISLSVILVSASFVVVNVVVNWLVSTSVLVLVNVVLTKNKRDTINIK